MGGVRHEEGLADGSAPDHQSGDTPDTGGKMRYWINFGALMVVMYSVLLIDDSEPLTDRWWVCIVLTASAISWLAASIERAARGSAPTLPASGEEER